MSSVQGGKQTKLVPIFIVHKNCEICLSLALHRLTLVQCASCIIFSLVLQEDYRCMSGTTNRHVNRLNHVLNFAHNNWDKDLNLDLLAHIACISKYHFIKLFHEHSGETPIGFLKRIRLENAAHWLSYRREFSINNTALNCGF